MIHILIGNDTLNKGNYIKELTRNCEVVYLSANFLTKEMILNYGSNISLFGESPIVLVDNIISDSDFVLSPEELLILKNSDTVFIFKEDKMLALEQKKYKKYAEINIFENKKVNNIQKFNVFSITDAFANKDKINTWTLYRKGIEEGVEPEAIAGVLFWKIKTMLLNGSRFFNKDELKKCSSRIISIYHKAHRGEVDFSIGLEQFILSTLSSK